MASNTILNDKKKLEAFPLRIKQECLLSQPLNIIADVPANATWQENKIKDIQIGKKNNKKAHSAYDMTVENTKLHPNKNNPGTKK